MFELDRLYGQLCQNHEDNQWVYVKDNNWHALVTVLIKWSLEGTIIDLWSNDFYGVIVESNRIL